METTKWCPGCERQKPVDDFYTNTARYDGLSGLCRLCHIAETNARSERQRLQAIGLLGGRCSWLSCAVPGGMTDPRALQFDHIDGHGTQRRRAGEHMQAVVKAILAGSTDFQLLCANCNWIKRYEQDEHGGDTPRNRVIPAERKQGPGKGSHPNTKAAMANWWATATPEQIAARNAKISATKQARKPSAV